MGHDGRLSGRITIRDSVETEVSSRWSDELGRAIPEFMDSHDVLRRFAGRGVLVLHGSTTLGLDDAFSDLDVWWLLSQEDLTELDLCSPTRFFEFSVAGKPGHINAESAEAFDDRVTRCDMDLIFQLRAAVPLRDEVGALEDRISRARQPMPEGVREAFFHYHYSEMRSEHRACDNPMERQDAAAVLLSLPKAIAHSLRAAMVLDGQPYPYDKWLAWAARQTPTGRALVPSVERILDHLAAGHLRYEGGESTHPISLELREIRRTLIGSAIKAGIDKPWLKQWWLYMTEAKRAVRQVRWPGF